MRIWAIAGVAIVLLPGNAVGAAYQSVKEVCLFSATVPPADSALAIRSVGTDYDFVREFKTGLAGKPSSATAGAASMIATATISLKGLYDPKRYSKSENRIGEIDDAPDFDFRANSEYASAQNRRRRFRLSGISSAGIESNGFVAGFDVKY